MNFFSSPSREDIWYEKLPLKRDGLANIMKRMVEKTDIQNEGNFTNSAGRKTAIQSIQSLRGHFDPLAISELAWHAYQKATSIQSYSQNAVETQKEMFDRLIEPGRCSTAVYNSTATTVNATSAEQ